MYAQIVRREEVVPLTAMHSDTPPSADMHTYVSTQIQTHAPNDNNNDDREETTVLFMIAIARVRRPTVTTNLCHLYPVALCGE